MPQGQTIPIRRFAKFDHTRQYRYWLRREWDDRRPAIAFIMLNPSRADHLQDDPTLRRCIGLAQQWRCGSLTVVNLFAYCTASPQVLKTVPNPVGRGNDDHILQTCQSAERIVIAWGNGGCLHDRDRQVLKLLGCYGDRLFCLGKNLTGHPRHPLYVPRYTQPTLWHC